MRTSSKIILIALGVGLLLALTIVVVAANLGTTSSFAVLAGSTVTNTGTSVISGDVGLSPGTSITGFPPGSITGSQHIFDAVAAQAQTDLATLYNDTAGQLPVTTIATELGGTTLNAGNYDSSAGDFQITGTLTLDAQGDPNAVFIFKTASTFITAASSSVSLINGAQACNVYWQVGSSATLGTNSFLKGNILALWSITLTTSADVEGSVMAQNGAVTLDTNTITKAICSVPVVIPPVVTPTSTPPTTPTSTPPVTPTSTVPTSSAFVGGGGMMFVPAPQYSPSISSTLLMVPTSTPLKQKIQKLFIFPDVGAAPQGKG